MPNTLEFFRFQAAVGGFANDGDGYVAWLVFATPPDRDWILETLGVSLNGRLWVGDDLLYLSEHPDKFELWVTDNRVEGDKVFLSYSAGLAAWERASRIEAALQPLRSLLRVPEGPRIAGSQRPPAPSKV